MDEQRVDKLTQVLKEVAEIGGKAETSKIIPNLEVIDANPPVTTVPAGYIIVENEEGYYIPALEVPGVTYADGNLVNVLFIKGTEPIAMQQGSGSSSSGQHWKLISPDGTIDPVIYTDNSGNVTIAAVTGGNLYLDGTSSRVGINTITVPHGGVGAAMVAVEGADGSTDGPHIQFTTTVDDYPLLQVLPRAHDSVHLVFDAYHDGTWRSSDAGSNFSISKNDDILSLRYDSGVAQGAALTWNYGIALDTSGHVGIGTNVITQALTFGSSGDTIAMDTADAADNKSLRITGGGAAANTRGSFIAFYGNEHATDAGMLYLNPGGIAGMQVQIDNTIYVGDGLVGIGNAAPAALLDVTRTFTDGTRIIEVSAIAQPNANYFAVDIGPQVEPQANIGTIFGSLNTLVVENSAFNITSDAIACQYQVQLKANYSGTITRVIALNTTQPQLLGAATITEAVGMNVGAMTVATTNKAIVTRNASAANRWNLYLQGTAINYINGDTGIGLNNPQGKLHTYETISGFLLWEYDGLNATVRIAIPNGAGDVLYRLHAEYVLRNSVGAVLSGSTDVSNGASVNLVVGADTVRLRVNADGSCDVARTAGANTIKVALTLRWL